MKNSVGLPGNEIRECTPHVFIETKNLSATSTGEEVTPNDLNDLRISQMAFKSAIKYNPILG